MKRRFVYLLLFGLPTLITAAMVSVALFGVITGALWIFVLGDDPWPASAGSAVGVITTLVFAGVSIILLTIAYRTGKQQENYSSFNKKHLAFSLAATLALIGIATGHQYSVGNFGTPSYSVMCADYCRAQGFNASSLPPRDQGLRLCRCLDSHGAEAVTIPFDQIFTNKDP
jgi:hypothetical protein